jgi:hypothetical protein
MLYFFKYHVRVARALPLVAQRVGGDPYRVLGSAAGELTNGPVVVVLDQNWADAESVPTSYKIARPNKAAAADQF